MFCLFVCFKEKKTLFVLKMAHDPDPRVLIMRSWFGFARTFIEDSFFFFFKTVLDTSVCVSV